MTGSRSAAKAQVRADLLAARRVRTPLPGEAALLADRVLALLPGDGPLTVAAFLSQPTEPPTGVLLAALQLAGHRVLLPVLLADGDLDWAPAAPGDPGVPGLRGTTSPSSVPLGRDALREAALVVVPALACDRAGHRLGRGGGSYDRALPRAARGARVVALVHEEELLASVPVEDHDRTVDVVVTVTRTLVVPGR